MIKTLLGTFALTCAAHLALAQGISFEKGDWKSVREKAVKEKKLIYLDVYTTWCGPCKMMARNYFPQEKAGALYNQHFVNYQIDAEKGEGLAIAEQYKVTGYPTNLFLDAATGKVVYRTSGMPVELEGFLENANTAIEESKDPMDIAGYEKKFAGGKYDEAFIKKYLQKNARLGIDNDALLDAYLKKFSGSEVSDSTLLLLSAYQSGIDNTGYMVLKANSSRLDKLLKRPGHFEGMSGEYYRNSIHKATEAKNEKDFDRLLAKLDEFEKEDPKGTRHYYQQQFYKTTGQEDKAYAVDVEYADYVSGLSKEEVASQSQKQMESAKAQIKWQLEQMNTPKEQMEGLLQKNMERPEIKFGKEIGYANQLNNMAWDVYEKNKDAAVDREKVTQAAKWAKKGMELSEVSDESWIAIADTYAHLVALLGDKKTAIEVEQKAIDKAKAAGRTDMADYEQFIKDLQ